MRVLHVSDMNGVQGGGEPSYVRRLMEWLAAEGHTFDWWAPSHHPPSGVDEVFALWNLRQAYRLRQKIKRFNPDLVHVHGFYHRLSGAVLGTIPRAGIPAVLTAHAFGSVCPRLSYVRVGQETCQEIFPARACFGPCLRHEPLRNAVRYPRLYLAQEAIRRHVSLIMAPSRHLAGILERRFPDLPCRHVPHPLPFGPPRPSWPEARSRRHFLYVGRMLKSKGIEVILRALAALPASGERPFRLQIAGDGSDRDFARRLAEELGILERVEFLGHRSPEEVLELMAGCGALVVPSIVPETGPLVVLEALAVGAPIVATRHGGASELIEDGTHGFLVEPSNVEALAAGMRRITALPEAHYRQMLDAVHRRALDFTPERHYDRVLDVYREALGRPAARPRQIAGS